MTYCISDIHGDLEKFEKILDAIRFSEDDVLYIIGDAIDRGPHGVDVLRKIMNTENMVMILGNHERMLLDTLDMKYVTGAKRLWMLNGGEPTMQELVNFCAASERHEIMKFLRNLPDHMDIEVNGQAFHLVHGFPSKDNLKTTLKTRLWGRPRYVGQDVYEEKTVIVGHTPTCYLTNDYCEPFRIVCGNRLIGIDCGCGSGHRNSSLACLRLENFEEFYVREECSDYDCAADYDSNW